MTSTNALDANPLFVSNIAYPSGDPIHRGDCNGRCGGMLDFLDIIVAPSSDGDFWGTAVDTCTELDECNSKPVTGLSGERTRNDSADMQGLAFKQIGGPALRSGENQPPPGNGDPEPVIPEVPLVAVLPVAAVLTAGAVLLVDQRRRRRAHA